MQNPPPMRHLQLRLEDTRSLSPSVRHLVFSVEGEPAAFRSGQCLNLHVPVQGEVFPRLYSIACSPRPDGGRRVELVVTRVPDGPVSNALHAMAPGTLLEAGGPCGGLVREETEEPTLFIGTGSGLGPLRAMLHDELSRADGPKVGLLFGCRTEQDILWADELRGWAQQHPRFSLFITLSRGAPSWTGRRGWVQHHLGDALAKVQPTRIFVCGLSAMTSAIQDALGAVGFPDRGLHLEEYDT